MRTFKCHSLARTYIARDIKKQKPKEYWGISGHLFNLVLTRIFELKIERMYKTGYINLGRRMGYIGIQLIQINRQKLTDRLVDWYATNNLWKNDPKAKEAKTLVRNIKTTKAIYYCWKDRRMNNLKYYSFTPSRPLKLRLNKDMLNNKPIMFLE